jgi:hypothetical protein
MDDIYGSSEDIYGAEALHSNSYSGLENSSDEIRFENEYNVYERVGGYRGDILDELGTTEENVDIRDPLQRFINFTKIMANTMNTQGIIHLRRHEINYIVDQIQYIKEPQYKNPTAFVLGFWVTNRDGTINKDKVNNIAGSLSLLPYPIRNYDIIRYANLWIDTQLYNMG